MQKNIWIIDDEQAICWALKKAIDQAGYRAITFSNAEDALKVLNSTTQLDAVMLDMRMPGMDGFAATAEIKKIQPDVPIIMMTAFGDLSSAIQAMEYDIFEYLPKPFDLADGLKALTKALAKQVNFPLSTQPIEPWYFDTLLGSSPAMQQVYKQIAMAAKSDVPVLIHGPSGTGKESIASAIHRHSRRSESPFLAFSPLSIPPIALAMELLGIFLEQRSSQRTDKSGAFQRAGDGVLFIDEVSDLPKSLQAQLLRVLEQKSYLPLGDSTARPCEARIMASTSRNLLTAVEEGDFLEELHQRLSVFSIEVLPLSERPSDILPLAYSMLRSRVETNNVHFTPEAETWLINQAWAGNLRELQIAIDHALVVAKDHRIGVDDLIRVSQSTTSMEMDDHSALSDEVRRWIKEHLQKLNNMGRRVGVGNDEDFFGTMYEDFLSSVEPSLLRGMLLEFQGNRAAIAAQLGIHRSTLRQKMRRYKIE
ncbi:MAG: sigma-54 dependent transcriptional regulator [Planctomycetota bacterium]|nr:sigma-54 dependent transcriptional regulator [Planctomycetota bacterium]